MSLSKQEEILLREAPKSFSGLIEFLTGYLNWPLPANMEPEDVTPIDWTLDELHLDDQEVARLRSVSQLPKFIDSQPFGAFVLEFEEGLLPIGVVRRVVSQLIKKKRSQIHVSHQQWDLEDLLFFCQSTAGKADIHLVSFTEIEGKAVLKAISWSTDSTENRLEVIADHNLTHLKWSDEINDRRLPGSGFSNAFTATYRQGIRSASLLASSMAQAAIQVRDEVTALLPLETSDGPLRQLFEEVRTRLDATLSEARFADMYAQTMVYGLLTARITHPEDFVPGNVIQVLKFENPFLDALYSRFKQTGNLEIEVDEFGLHELTELLAETDVDELLADFGVEDHRDDPVVFFYENFLEVYDKAQRKELGTYYTPTPIVKFITKAVNSLIQNNFGLDLGVADNSTWAEYSKLKGINIPLGQDPSSKVISFLDPATGTGTFVLEWLKEAFRILEERGSNNPQRRAQVIDSIDAFEISLSSYSVAELKVNLEIDAETRKYSTPRIRLTDSLEGERLSALFGDDPLAKEGQLAQYSKFETRHSVVVGNPPYLRATANSSGGWITNPSDGGKSLFEDIHKPARENTIFSHQASLYNLYVYFWRFAIWKAFEQNPEGPGIVAFITANSWISGPGFMGLRKLSREFADEIFVIDLGGDGYSASQGIDENVFPIQTPVSIVILLRNGQTNKESSAKVQYCRIAGTKKEKLGWLLESNFPDIEFKQGPAGFLQPFSPEIGDDKWTNLPLLTDLIPWQQPGTMWNRTWPISPNAEILMSRWNYLVTRDSLDEKKVCFSEGSSGRDISTAVNGLPTIAEEQAGAPHLPITRLAYRSFDRQWCLADPRLAKTESPSLWASLSKNQVFLVTIPTGQLGSGPGATVSVDVPDKHYFNGRGGKDVFPMYRDTLKTPNIDPALLNALTQLLSSEGETPIEFWPKIFSYIYGVLAGTDFTDRFASELGTPGPRIPITKDKKLFLEVSDFGAKLLCLQTYGERFEEFSELKQPEDSGIYWQNIPKIGPVDSKEIVYSPETSNLKIGDGVISGVSEACWNFSVSGMPVIKKWLGYRTHKGAGKAVSSKSPLDHIRLKKWDDSWTKELLELVSVITETIQMIPNGVKLLDKILASDQLQSGELPVVNETWRRVPAAKDWWLNENDSLF